MAFDNAQANHTTSSMDDNVDISDSVANPAGRLPEFAKAVGVTALDNNVQIDYERDKLLTPFGSAVMRAYLQNDETPQDVYARVANHYGSDQAHAQRLYDYMSRQWFSPASPILSNGGTSRGLPISCYIASPDDSRESIIEYYKECAWLASNGGGIGSGYGKLRSIGEKVGRVGETSGAISFAKVLESLMTTFNQGSLRRANAAIYINIDHPEIEDFINMRNPVGGDPGRKLLNLHHGVFVSDKFMRAVENDENYDLVSPKTGESIKSTNARAMWLHLLKTRIETGEPYITFADTVDRGKSDVYKELGLSIKSSNLCNEIMLASGEDHRGQNRTAVCCLSSLNLVYWDAWRADKQFIPDVMEMLDNVLTDFIDNSPQDTFKNAIYSAMRERAVGLGVMGLHSYLQAKMIPFESALAKSFNMKAFKHIRAQADQASIDLADRRGPAPDAKEAGYNERFVYKLAVAPTATISNICGTVSPGIEPLVANSFLQKTLHGSFQVKNQYLEQLLTELGCNTQSIWASIESNNGSVQHLEFLNEQQKLVFKTAAELDQRWLVDLAADRAPFIDQSQSVNLFFPSNAHKKDIAQTHMMAWRRGVKSLYYCRSIKLKGAESSTKDATSLKAREIFKNPNDFDECLACQ